MKHSSLAVLGLAVIAFLCIQLLRHTITLSTAAGRAVATVVILAIVDRLAVPIAAALVHTPGRDEVSRDRGDNAGRLPQLPFPLDDERP